MSSLSRLDGKVALITGSSSGIGAETAILFCKLGADVAITGRNDENLAKTAAECVKWNRKRVLTVSGDLTKEGFVKQLLEETLKHHGRLDILVNNAGIFKSGSIETSTLDQYDEIMNTNMRAVYHLTMLAVPHLVKTKGSIINVSSVASIGTIGGMLAYSMSKSALDQFTKCIAIELAPKQVRVNSINPGTTDTNTFKRNGMDEDTKQKFLESAKTFHPLGRVGQVEDMASAIAFLASDSASFITGVQLPVDGGRQAILPR